MDATSEMKKAIAERKKLADEKVKQVKSATALVEDARHKRRASQHHYL